MTCSRSLASVAVCIAVLVSTPAAYSVEFDMLTIGDPGNKFDRVYGTPSLPARFGKFGAVNYTYQIGLTELTNPQYAEFLNAVAKSDPHELFDTRMETDLRGGIDRNGTDGNYSYTVKEDYHNKPVNFLMFWDAARYINWLENGQPTGPQGDDTTERGTYNLDGVTFPDNVTIHRQPGSKWFIPSENEWYKAAHYDPRSANEGGPPGNDNYWLYPTQSDFQPEKARTDDKGDVINGGGNVANYHFGASWGDFRGSKLHGHVSSVGTAGVTSYYGAFDMAGNVWEFNESIIRDPGRDATATFRGNRGACWDDPGFLMGASIRAYGGIENCGTIWLCTTECQGLRIASLLPDQVEGDFNGDGFLSAADIDLLSLEVRGELNAVSMDITGDSLVDQDDRIEWVSRANIKFGDSNFDGRFDSIDLVQVFQTNEYEDDIDGNSTWAEGDWNGDGDFDSGDLVFTFQSGTYDRGVAIVPEPNVLGLTALMFVTFAFRRFR